MAVRTYDSGEVQIILGTRRLTGLAADTFVEVERDEQTFTKKVGADGEVTRSKTRNKAGQVRITLDQSSRDNAYLQSLHNQDENDGTGIVPVKVIDKSGNPDDEPIAFAPESWVQKPSVKGYGRDNGTRQWVIDTGVMDETGGGN